MKVEIEMLNFIPYAHQMEAVDIYIKNNTTGHVKTEGFIDFYYAPIIKETKKDTGQRVETDHRNFHVSCRRTTAGMYKFKVWQAV